MTETKKQVETGIIRQSALETLTEKIKNAERAVEERKQQEAEKERKQLIREYDESLGHFVARWFPIEISQLDEREKIEISKKVGVLVWRNLGFWGLINLLSATGTIKLLSFATIENPIGIFFGVLACITSLVILYISCIERGSYRAYAGWERMFRFKNHIAFLRGKKYAQAQIPFVGEKNQ